MPQLLLMRHGKAAQTTKVADIQRPLTPRGQRDCAAMGEVIARDWRPDHILCSPAVRTRQTLEAVLAVMGETGDVVMLDDLYGAAGDYSGIITSNAGKAERLLVIGHNPAIQETAVTLIGEGDGRARAAIHEKFPTSAVAVISFDRPWRQVQPLSGRLTAFLTP